MGLLLVQRETSVPCFVETSAISIFEEVVLPLMDKGAKVIICNKYVRMTNQKRMLIVVWHNGSMHQFVHCWVDTRCIYVGAMMIRRIQSAWRRHVSRRRHLSLCMALHPRLGAGCDPGLVRALQVLCVDELSRWG